MVEPNWVENRALERRFKPLFHVSLDRVYVSAAYGLLLCFENVLSRGLVIVPTGTPIGRPKNAIQTCLFAGIKFGRIMRSIPVQARQGKEVPTIQRLGFRNCFHCLPGYLHAIRVEKDHSTYAMAKSFRASPRSVPAKALHKHVGVTLSQDNLTIWICCSESLKLCEARFILLN